MNRASIILTVIAALLLESWLLLIPDPPHVSRQTSVSVLPFQVPPLQRSSTPDVIERDVASVETTQGTRRQDSQMSRFRICRAPKPRRTFLRPVNSPLPTSPDIHASPPRAPPVIA